MSERVALLVGMDTDVLQQCFDERVTYTPGARSLVQTMVRDGAHTVLVSGGFTFFTSRVSEWLGFKVNKANVLGIEGGHLTGKVEGDIVNADTKKQTPESIAADLDLKASEIVAVGDGANDIPMIDAAGLGAAFHAKPKARDAADFAINHTNLAALLFVQGYSRDEFVADR